MTALTASTASTASGSLFPTIFFITLIYLVRLGILALLIYLAVLLIRSLRKYLSGNASKETAAVRKSLGETLREHRQNCNMTQEFVAEQLHVSRQAVSKWETGASEPSTSNLLSLAKLYGVDAGELLKNIET